MAIFVQRNDSRQSLFGHAYNILRNFFAFCRPIFYAWVNLESCVLVEAHPCGKNAQEWGTRGETGWNETRSSVI